MTAWYIGGMSIGAAVPGAAAAASAGADGINTAFPDIEARLTALAQAIAALASMPPLPTFPDMVARAAANLAGLQVAVSTPGLPPPPSLSTAIATLSALVADLNAMLAALNVKLTLITDFQGVLATSGLHVITYDGPRSNVGLDVDAQISAHVGGSGTTHTNALVLVTTSGATWTKVGQVFQL